MFFPPPHPLGQLSLTHLLCKGWAKLHPLGCKKRFSLPSGAPPVPGHWDKEWLRYVPSDLGARPQPWASPPTPLSLQSLVSASPVSFLLPRDWQRQVEQKEVTQQVTGASRENRTFSSLQVTLPTSNSVTTWNQTYLCKPLYLFTSVSSATK